MTLIAAVNKHIRASSGMESILLPFKATANTPGNQGKEAQLDFCRTFRSRLLLVVGDICAVSRQLERMIVWRPTRKM
jgi:hypothetical protein